MATTPGLPRLAVVLSFAACAGRTGTRPAPVSAEIAAVTAPTADAPAAAPPPLGVLVRCDATQAGVYADWHAWLKPLLDTHGAVDRDKARALAYKATPETDRLLRRGLKACDALAPEAIVATYRGLQGDLTALLRPNSVWAATPQDTETAKLFRLAVLRSLTVLASLTDQGRRSPPDHSDLLVPLLSDASERVRADAVSTARQVTIATAEAALLDRVQHGADDRIRRETAAILLAIWDVYPRAIEDHADLVKALGPSPESVEVGPDRHRFGSAVRILERLRAARRASGYCSARVQPARIHTRLGGVSDNMVALGFDELEGSCGTGYAFVVFVESLRAFGNGLPARLVSDADSALLEVPGPAGPISIIYQRRPGVVRVAGVEVARGQERVALVSVVGSDVKVVLQREYSLETGRDGDAIREVWNKVARLVSTTPPPAFETPWPAVLPCARAARLTLHEGTDDDVTWSGRDGKTSWTVPRAAARQPVPLDRRFPIGALDRMTSRGFPPAGAPHENRELLAVACLGDAAVSWGPCTQGRCAPKARYRASREPKSRRTQTWTAPMRYPLQDEAPEIHYSRFKQRIGYRKAGDPEIARQSIRLAHDLAADLLEVLRGACQRGRCSEAVVAAPPALEAFIRDRSPRYNLLEHLKAYDHWNSGWYWILSSGGHQFKAGCHDISESREVFCSLEFDVGDGLRLHFDAKNGYSPGGFDVALFDRNDHGDGPRETLGSISYGRDERHRSWVDVEGRALATAAR